VRDTIHSYQVAALADSDTIEQYKFTKGNSKRQWDTKHRDNVVPIRDDG